VVIDVLLREKVIDARTAARAKVEKLALAPPLEAAGAAPYYVAAVRRALKERFGENADVMGLRVHTGLDPAIQKAAQAALVAQLERMEAGAYGAWRHERPPTGRLTPAQGSGSPYVQGLVIVLDARSGAVRALVGGRDFTHSSYDRAFSGRRQPGSAFKPIVYAAALQHGLSPAARIDATPVELALTGAAWRPDDHVPDSITSLSVRDALALSSNNAAVRVGEWAGIDRVAAMAATLGLTTDVPHYPSVLLGAAEVSPAELTAAYATLGNGGFRVRPTLVTRVEDAHGRVLWRAADARERIIDQDIAFLTTSMLQDVVDRGTGTAVRSAGFQLPAAGKTGTTNDARDVWFIGMTPDLAAGVWIGFDQPKQILPRAFGGTLAAPVWARTMTAAYETRPAPAPWQPPPSLASAAIDVASGMLATPSCPPDDVRTEYFVPGTEPADHCPLHPHGAIDRLLRGLRIRR
jgi:penicillin-binding protein 1A